MYETKRCKHFLKRTYTYIQSNIRTYIIHTRVQAALLHGCICTYSCLFQHFSTKRVFQNVKNVKHQKNLSKSQNFALVTMYRQIKLEVFVHEVLLSLYCWIKIWWCLSWHNQIKHLLSCMPNHVLWLLVIRVYIYSIIQLHTKYHEEVLPHSQKSTLAMNYLPLKKAKS